jgi:acetoin utilization deacetylase AcuC-like enzyme
LNIYFNKNYTASLYAFDTTRKSGDVAESLLNQPFEGVTLVDPVGFAHRADALIQKIHSADYYSAVKSGTPVYAAESQGFTWDEGIFPMALNHTAGVVAAADEALKFGRTAGTLSSGLHHAKHSAGEGYCTFNGLAVAARHAVEAGARVLILDFDAHCGGGTYSLLQDVGGDVVQLDVSVSGYDMYRTESNHRLVMSESGSYEWDINATLDYAKTLGKFDLCLYNAGMDPYNCGVTIDELITREDAVAAFCSDNVPATAFTLAGGYTWGDVEMGEIVDLHRLTVSSFQEAHNLKRV